MFYVTTFVNVVLLKIENNTCAVFTGIMYFKSMATEIMIYFQQVREDKLIF